jgi:hypothetical protein
MSNPCGSVGPMRVISVANHRVLVIEDSPTKHRFQVHAYSLTKCAGPQFVIPSQVLRKASRLGIGSVPVEILMHRQDAADHTWFVLVQWEDNDVTWESITGFSEDCPRMFHSYIHGISNADRQSMLASLE